MTVVKVVELVGESPSSFEDAVGNAVKEAAETVDNISGVEILNLTADVDGGEVVEYKADVHVAFAVDRTKKKV